MNDATSTKQSLDATTGLVVLASNDTTDRYWWSYDPLGGTPPVVQPPVAAFSATPTSGSAPLEVAFADLSTNLPTGWAWDFDGDSVIDSTAQNPTFTYTSCGDFNVSLTVTDASHPPSTLTKPAFVRTDAIAANFTMALIGPLLVQFTDASNMAATAWAWDLDGDSIVDSTVQNPA